MAIWLLPPLTEHYCRCLDNTKMMMLDPLTSTQPRNTPWSHRGFSTMRNAQETFEWSLLMS